MTFYQYIRYMASFQDDAFIISTIEEDDKYFVSVDNFENINDINFHLLRNGEKVQIGNTKDMIFNISKLITHISKYFLIHQGDYIYTGTPAGVGKIEIGDKLEGFIEDQKFFRCDIK